MLIENLSDAEIHALVHRFYDKVRKDPELSPVFEAHISEWGVHLAKMEDFWSSVANTSGRYKGQPMLAHMRLPELQQAHFGRWLELFRETARAELRPEGAALVIDRAERIAEASKMGLEQYRQLPPELRA